MQNRFVKNLALLLFLNLLVKPFWILGIDRTVQNEVGEVMFGLYFSLFNFSYLFYILLDLGITNFNNRNIAQNNQLLSKHFSGIATMKLILGLVYAGVVFGVGMIYGYKGEQLVLLAWVVLNQVFLSFILYIRSNFSGLLLFKTDSFLSILDRLLMILICGFLLWSGFISQPFQLLWFVYAQSVAYALTFIIAFVMLVPHLGKVRFSFNWPFMVMIIRRSLPFALLVLLMSFYSRIEPVLLTWLIPGEAGLHQSGIYAQSFRLLDAGNNIALLFSVLLLPLFASLLKKKEAVDGLVKACFTLMLLMSVLVAIVSQFFSREIIELLYGIRDGELQSDYLLRIGEASAVFGLLMTSFVAISSTYVFGTLLTANGSLKHLNIVASTGVAVNLIMNLVLIPQWAAQGAAIASLTAQFFTAALQFWLAKRTFNLCFGIRFWMGFLVYTILIVVFIIVFKALYFNWVNNILLTVTFSTLSAVALKIIPYQNILSLFKSAAQTRD
jgi:O-antigen/teichoic acid export membrane protein